MLDQLLIMLRRLLEQKAAVDELMFQKREFDLVLNNREWHLLGLLEVNK